MPNIPKWRRKNLIKTDGWSRKKVARPYCFIRGVCSDLSLLTWPGGKGRQKGVDCSGWAGVSAGAGTDALPAPGVEMRRPNGRRGRTCVTTVPHDRSENQWVIRAKVIACVSTQCRMPCCEAGVNFALTQGELRSSSAASPLAISGSTTAPTARHDPWEGRTWSTHRPGTKRFRLPSSPRSAPARMRMRSRPPHRRRMKNPPRWPP